MVLWGELLAFMGVLALGQFSPGPDMLLLTRTSLAEGRRAGWLTMLGIVTGLALHATVAIGGMAVVLSRGGWLATGFRIAAALYLAWLGYGLLRHFFIARYGAVKAEEVSVSRDGRSWYVRGFLCNVLNLKVAIFFAGVVAPFLEGVRPGWWPYALWGILVFEGVVLWGLWVAVLQHPRVRGVYQRASLWIDLFFGLALLTLAVLLAVG
jgi:threonine efflux protein